MGIWNQRVKPAASTARMRLVATGGLVMLASCIPPSSAFYVQDSSRLKTVSIVECSEVTFRDIDYGNKAKRQACTKRTLNSAQRRIFEKHRGEIYDVSLVPVPGVDEPDEGP